MKRPKKQKLPPPLPGGQRLKHPPSPPRSGSADRSVVRWFSFAALMVLLLGPGCGFLGDILGTSPRPAPSPPPRASTPPAPAVSAGPAQPEKLSSTQEPSTPDDILKTEQYRYVTADKRDPFRPFIILTRTSSEPPLPPLQRYDIAQLRLVGIVLGGENSRAMVEDASGKGYVVSKGTRIGRRNGVVVRIEKDCVVVEEQYKDSVGNLKSKENRMNLHKVEGEGT